MKNIVRLIICLVIVTLVYLGSIDSTNTQTVETSVPAPIQTPAQTIPIEVQPIVVKLGIKPETLRNVKIVVNGTCEQGNLRNTPPIACFSSSLAGADGAITLTTLNRPDVHVIFAHEYMHYIYSKLSQDDKVKYAQVTNSLYQRYPQVRDRIKNYVNDQNTKNNELHSYVCTEMLDTEIPEPLKSHCLQYLPNRNALPSLY